MALHPLVLLTSAGLAFWLAARVLRRVRTPGSLPFVWLFCAAGTWCGAGGLAHGFNNLLAGIFTPFYTTKPTGHGLGVAAVHDIVRGHRGVLRLDTRPGEGARFRVWLPLAGAAAHNIASSPSSPSYTS